MKPLIISLMILVSGGQIEIEKIEIFDSSCYTWYKENVRVTERKKKLFSSLYYHSYKGKKVVGYICNDKEPK